MNLLFFFPVWFFSYRHLPYGFSLFLFFLFSFTLSYDLIWFDLIWSDEMRYNIFWLTAFFFSNYLLPFLLILIYWQLLYVFKSSFFKNEIQKIYLSISSYSVKKDFWSFRVTKRNWPIVDCPHFVPELSSHFGIGELGKDGIIGSKWSNLI